MRRPTPNLSSAASGLGLYLMLALSACGTVPTVAQLQSRIPPLAPGAARVWFLQQFEPGETLYGPLVYANGTPITTTLPGTAFYRDFAPGTYAFAAESCRSDVNQTVTLSLAPGTRTDLEIQSLRSISSPDCLPPETFYVRAIPPARAELYFQQLSYRGAL